jgi:T6SS, Transcription factor, DNA binding domain
VARTRSSVVPPASVLEVSRLSTADLRRALDGWHAVVQLGGTRHRLWLRELPAEGSSLVVELPLDADFEVRSHAAHRLWSALGKRALESPYPALSFQRRQRLALAVRALDGRTEGSSYREIAEVLFGKERIPKRAWKTHDLRNRTIRLVQSGLALMRGGYRALLRHGRKRN